MSFFLLLSTKEDILNNFVNQTVDLTHGLRPKTLATTLQAVSVHKGCLAYLTKLISDRQTSEAM